MSKDDVQGTKKEPSRVRDDSYDTQTPLQPTLLPGSPFNILGLQRHIGNRATTQFLQREALPAPRVAYNTDVKRGFEPLADQPEARALLLKLLPLAYEAIEEFRDFRDVSYENAKDTSRVAHPAQRLANAAFQTKQELARIADQPQGQGVQNNDNDAWGVQNLLAKAHSGYNTLQHMAFLQSHLDSEQLTLLQHAMSFSQARHMAAIGSLFGLNQIHIEHNYELTLRTAENWVTTPHTITVRYSNNIGMRYEKVISLRWFGGGASLLQGEIMKKIGKGAKGQFSGIIEEKIEQAFGMDPAYSEKTVSLNDTNQFWLPDWFADGNITQFAMFAKAGYKHVLAQGLGDVYLGFHLLTFSYGGKQLTFDMSEDLFKIDPNLPAYRIQTIKDIRDAVRDAIKDQVIPDMLIDEENAEDLKKGRLNIPKLISGDIEAEWEAMYKVAWDVKSLDDTRRSEDVEIDFTLRKPVAGGGSAWQPFVTTDLYFETGSSIINAEGYAAISVALSKMRNYLRQDPNAALRFIVLGKASRAWKHLKNEETAAEKNLILSQERADRVLSYIQQLRPQLLGDLLPELIEDSTRNESRIHDSAEGLGSTDDAMWMGSSEYKKKKSRKRSMKGKDDNSATERGAMIRIAIRPTPEEAANPDAKLKKKRSEYNLQDYIEEMAAAQAAFLMNENFTPGKSDGKS